MRLTDAAQAFLEPALRPGALAIDATAGNGHDTVFLARRIQPGGRVAAFDVQSQALATTQSALATHGLAEHAHLIHDSHEHMARHLGDWIGNVAAVMFNLGYLPHGDHRITTLAQTTVTALDAATAMLRPGGRMTVMTYPGHPAGAVEDAAVARWLAARPSTFFDCIHGTATLRPSPRLYRFTRSA